MWQSEKKRWAKRLDVFENEDGETGIGRTEKELYKIEAELRMNNNKKIFNFQGKKRKSIKKKRQKFIADWINLKASNMTGEKKKTKKKKKWIQTQHRLRNCAHAAHVHEICDRNVIRWRFFVSIYLFACNAYNCSLLISSYYLNGNNSISFWIFHFFLCMKWRCFFLSISNFSFVWCQITVFR